MKNRFFAVALTAVMVVGFSACGKKNSKSSECEIDTFTVAGQAYTINHANGTILWEYPKTFPTPGQNGVWASEPEWPEVPVVKLKSNKADYSPKDGRNFVANEVEYTVTAEDGTIKKYKVKAQRGE